MSEVQHEGAPLTLTDDQKEEMRTLLERVGGSAEMTRRVEQENAAASKTRTATTVRDPFTAAAPGSTVRWDQLNASCLKYQIVREINVAFESLMRDCIPVQRQELERLVREHTSAEPRQTSMVLYTCAVTQADPILMFHLQVAPTTCDEVVVEEIRFLV